MTTFWIIGTVLVLMLALHIFRRFAAPYRLYIYVGSGKVVRMNVKDFNARPHSLKWTPSRYVSQAMTITDLEHVQVVKAVDRRYNF